MNLKLKHIIKAYNAVKKRAWAEYDKGNYNKSLWYVEKAVIISSQIMWSYMDEEFESLLIKISQKVLIPNKSPYKVNANRVVFYDGFGLTYILTIQYIKALVALGKEILYVYEEKEHAHNKLVPLFDILQQYPNITIKTIQATSDSVAKIKAIYDTITEFEPSQLFLHVGPFGGFAPALYQLPKEITRYYINLGDHVFWLGTKGIDYCFEFRSFGATISHEKRGLKKEQLLLLPYYPITEDKTFLGFPEETKGKVVIFSGGDFYKTVDKHNTYWELVKALLNENPEAVVLFACKLGNNQVDSILNDFIISNGFQNRFIPIGFRPDINEVFTHCDIFMGTCPMSGGLMSQYAAVNAKPILQFYPAELSSNNETESVICFNGKLNISFTDKDAFLVQAKRLINDKEYRENFGKQIASCLITEKQFNEIFAKSIETHHNQVEIEQVNVQYDALVSWWLQIGDKGYYDIRGYIYSILGIRGLVEAPCITAEYLAKRYLADKLFNYKWYLAKMRKEK
jgi:hypothetical protein